MRTDSRALAAHETAARTRQVGENASGLFVTTLSFDTNHGAVGAPSSTPGNFIAR